MDLATLPLLHKTISPSPERRHDGKVAVLNRNQRRSSDGFEFRCDIGSEPPRVMFVPDRCEREAMSYVAMTSIHSGDVMSEAVEKRLGNVRRRCTKIEWLTNNGLGYGGEKPRAFGAGIDRRRSMPRVCGQQSNATAESFVMTMKRDYIFFVPKPDAATGSNKRANAFKHYSEKHTFSALEFRAPRRIPAESRFIIQSWMQCSEVPVQSHRHGQLEVEAFGLHCTASFH
ncbi:hypothetical protein [Trinickia mobilis]|uniref:hypothetical protein n=1 Tax=Trinickia mobilis TaxID=2816356 RepID=UPI001A8E8FAA|nr:hypothetical protein [Trinickia mobilis]